MANKRDQPPAGGYGKPPKEHQFAKGRSGNPQGRPRGTPNFSTAVREVLSLPVPMGSDGGQRRKKISTQQAALLRLREKALKGDGRALDKLLDLAKVHNGGTETAPQRLDADDQAILDAYAARIREEAFRTPSLIGTQKDTSTEDTQ